MSVLYPSVCPHGTTRLPLDGFWLNFIFETFRKSVAKVQVCLKSTKTTGTLHGDASTFMTIYHWILLRMRNVSNKVVEKIKAHILCCLFSEDLVVYGITSKNMVEPDRTQTMWHMRVAYWKSKHAYSRARTPPPPTHTHTRARARWSKHALTHALASTHKCRSI